MAGTFSSSLSVQLQHITLPEYFKHRTYHDLPAQVMITDCRYDIIFGRDACRLFGIKIDFDNDITTIDNETVRMRAFPSSNTLHHDDLSLSFAEAIYIDTLEEDLFPNDDYPSHPAKVIGNPSDTNKLRHKNRELTANTYQSEDIERLVKQCHHLTNSQQQDLHQLLIKFPTLFDGILREYPQLRVKLDIDPHIPPHASRAYSVPHSQLKLFKTELDRLVNTGVLEPGNRSQWISGTFIVPKKDAGCRWVSDFRALNRAIVRKVYPIPRIKDILERRKGYQFISTIDLSMCFYTYVLDERSRDLTTIATPFGLYRYARLPMGVSCSPDIAQEMIEKTLAGIDGIEAYIDDIAVFSSSWQQHINTLDQVLTRLSQHGFAVRCSKCQWGVKSTEFLGFLLTPTGVMPHKRKVRAVLDMKEPTNLSELRSFIGLVNFYRDMWPRRAHTLSPLTDLTGKAFVWGPPQRKAFLAMKALITTDALLHYPDHNLPYDIETDASDLQLGAVIKQNGRPVAYYSRKLLPAQRRYTTIEKELLSIVETFREFRSILLGAQIRVHTDHKNLTYKMTQYSTQRVLRWRVLLEEFGPKFFYKKGTDNTIADALSRVPTSRTDSILADAHYYYTYDPTYDICYSDPDLACCLSHHPPLTNSIPSSDAYMQLPFFDNNRPFHQPFHFDTIRQYQDNDEPLQTRAAANPQSYKYRRLGRTDVLCHLNGVGASTPWQIAIPDNMLERLVQWYHAMTVYVEGPERLETTIKNHFYHPRLSRQCRETVRASHIRQRMKVGHRQYGHLAPRDANLFPWHDVHVDTTGPWKVKSNGIDIEYQALTCINPVYNLLEIAPLKNKTSRETARVFNNTWLSRYPRPARCIHDNGPEFKGDFQDLLLQAGIKPVPITPHTPQANSVIEATHLAVGQVIRTLQHLKPPTTTTEANHLVDEACATAMHASRCASNINLGGFTPGALTYQRDMHLNIPLISNVFTLQKLRQARIDERLLRANSKRIPRDYAIGDSIYKKVLYNSSDKAKPVYDGPYRITRVHTNGTVTIALNPNTTERINI